MSKIRLFGTSSGYVEIAPAAAASNNTLTAPSTVGEIIAKDAAGAIGVTSVHTTNVVATGTAKVGAAVTISESGIEASGIGITCASINGTQIGGRRNLVINGAMLIAQRATSSTSDGYQTVDRFRPDSGNEDETPTQTQVDVSSGTSPYAEGFRRALRITNGNQTSGAGADDYVQIEHRFEAQNIANSGWNYTSSSSFITLSFWVKSSVSKDFQMTLRTTDGTSQSFQFETPTLSANTWTKVVKTIPGNSNLQFDNDVSQGMTIYWFPYIGTAYTSSSNTLNSWVQSTSSTYGVTDPTTWYTTNDATFELTGVQLEVGSQATAFEHRSKGEELELCKRYFQVLVDDGNAKSFGNATGYNSDTIHLVTPLRPEMRTTPTLEYTTGTDYYGAYQNNTVDYFNDWTVVGNSHPRAVDISAGGGVSITAGTSVLLRTTQSASKIRFTAEI